MLVSYARIHSTAVHQWDDTFNVPLDVHSSALSNAQKAAVIRKTLDIDVIE